VWVSGGRENNPGLPTTRPQARSQAYFFLGLTKLHLNSSDFGWIRSSACVRIVVVLLQIILPFLKKLCLSNAVDTDNGGKELLGFFFVRKKHAYTNGCWYPTPDGYWKLRRGQPTAIRHGGRVIALKTCMDFVRGRVPHGRRTPWSMSEYALNARHPDLRNLAQPTVRRQLDDLALPSSHATVVPDFFPKRHINKFANMRFSLRP
jgi:hypothetical protein